MKEWKAVGSFYKILSETFASISYSLTSSTFVLMRAFPPVLSARISPQTRHFTFEAALLKIVCSFLHLLHATFRNLLFDFCACMIVTALWILNYIMKLNLLRRLFSVLTFLFFLFRKRFSLRTKTKFPAPLKSFSFHGKRKGLISLSSPFVSRTFSRGSPFRCCAPSCIPRTCSGGPPFLSASPCPSGWISGKSRTPSSCGESGAHPRAAGFSCARSTSSRREACASCSKCNTFSAFSGLT